MAVPPYSLSPRNVRKNLEPEPNHPPPRPQGEFDTMLIARIKSAAAVVLGVAVLAGAAVLLACQPAAATADSEYKPPQRPLRVDPPHIATDKAVKYDYDIVY